MTVLPNPFLTSAASFPAAAEPGAATRTPTPSAAPEPISQNPPAYSGDDGPPSQQTNRTCSAAGDRASGELGGEGSEAAQSIHDPDATDNIGEIFTVPRRLLAEDNRRAEYFVDLAALEAVLDEELPTFLRDGAGHLRRWA